MSDRMNEKMQNLTPEDLENVAGGVVLAALNGKYEIRDPQGKALGTAATKEEAYGLAQKMGLPLHANMEAAREVLGKQTNTKSPMGTSKAHSQIGKLLP